MGTGMEEFRDLYIQTARERIQQLNDLLLKLESQPEELELIQELMRTGHSLKGESAAMGFEQLATLAHVIEDVFTAIGAGQLKINKDIMNELFSSIDYIQASVDSIAASPTGMDLDGKDYIKRLKDITGVKTEGFGKSVKTEDGKLAGSTAAAPATTSVTEPKTETAVTPDTTPASATPTQTPSSESSEKTANSSTPSEPAPASIPAATTATPSQPQPPAPTGVSAQGQKISTVTLKVEKLDNMINISEELVLLKMKLKNTKQIEKDSQLKADIHRLDRLVTDLQFHIMQARLFPISLATMALPRLVRDLSQKTGKKARLSLEGQETTVDRTIIDHLTEPFTHMIRNAIDHGIEAPEVRTKGGKPEEATITVNAYTKQNHFYVEVKDDGQGIEWDKVVSSAIKKGFVEAAVVAKWDLEQKKELLFMGGVSTSETVSDISGRGVGMSAVYAAIKKLGGSLSIDSELGKGTTFTFKLPMTLAIMQSLLVKVNRNVYAIPSSEVVRSLQMEENKMQSAGNRPVIVVDGQEVPVLDLRPLFATNKEKEAKAANDGTIVVPEEKKNDGMVTVVLIRRNLHIFGCIVNKIVAEEEVLVKPLGSLLKKQSNYFSGATILADGTAAPIVNIEGLVWKH